MRYHSIHPDYVQVAHGHPSFLCDLEVTSMEVYWFLLSTKVGSEKRELVPFEVFTSTISSPLAVCW
jgi:hypothetical protein